MGESNSRRWRPGSPHARYRSTSNGKFGESRYAWVTVKNLEAVLFVFDESTDDEAEPTAGKEPTQTTPDITLRLRGSLAKPLQLHLTSLRREELNLLKEILDMAFDLAEPICSLRDKEADDAFEQGDDSYERVYRPVPQLIIRNRRLPTYSESLRERRITDDGVEPDRTRHEDDHKQLRQQRDPVAEQPQKDLGSTDNW